ncbi:alpha/beta hydrolase [Magnetococcus sp. PR-3]|uniref:alpha/beta hydrolase n=1 Tax=Magnetococcus sp. PR-3 TaxID=3120355 RepID=UPI002FCE093D
MHWALWVGTILFFYAGVCAFMFFTQERQVFVPPRDWRTTPAEWGLDYESVQLKSEDHLLSSWFLPGELHKPVVLFFHGNASNIGDLSDYARLFHGLGYSSLLLDYRGYGQSQGKPSEQGLYQDAQVALAHLVQTRRFKPERVILFGHSLGGGPATWLAVHEPVGGLVLEGTFTSIPDRAAQLYPWLPIRMLAHIQFPNLKNIRDVKLPLLIIHSQEDEIIPIEHGRTLYRTAVGDKSMVTTVGPHDGGVELNIEAIRNGLIGLEGRMKVYHQQ